MRQSIFVVALLTSFTAVCDSISLEPFAREWVYTYAITPDGTLYVSDQELNLLVNLFYMSYKRSMAIIKLQEKALGSLDTVWNAWQHVTHLRRDPTNSESSSFDTQSMATHIHQFCDQLHKVQDLCTEFTALLHHLTVKDILSDQAQQALQVIQQEEQVIIAGAIAEIKHPDTLAHAPQVVTKGSSVLDFVWSCLPPLAIHSFVKTDQMTMVVTKENWNLLKALQELSNFNWATIEQLRASFHYSLYKATYQAVQQHVNAAQFFSSFFKQNQSIPAP